MSMSISSVLAQKPVLIVNNGNSDGSNSSLSCSYSLQYIALPFSLPRQGTAAYSLRPRLQCEDGTFGKLVGQAQRYDTDQTPVDIITGTVTLVPPGPEPYLLKTVALIIEELCDGIIQYREHFEFGDVHVDKSASNLTKEAI